MLYISPQSCSASNTAGKKFETDDNPDIENNEVLIANYDTALSYRFTVNRNVKEFKFEEWVCCCDLRAYPTARLTIDTTKVYANSEFTWSP